jgi:hypothetical protein
MEGYPQNRDHAKYGACAENERGAQPIPENSSQGTGNEHRETRGEIEETIGSPAQIRWRHIGHHGSQRGRHHTHMQSPEPHTPEDNAPPIVCCQQWAEKGVDGIERLTLA